MSPGSSLLILLLTFTVFLSNAQTSIPVEENGKWGLQDNDGNWIISATYEGIGWSNEKKEFINGVIGYQKNGFWGLLSTKGKRITNPIYRSLSYKGGNLFIASVLGKLSRRILYGLIDEKGRVVSSFKYLSIDKGLSQQFIVGELL
ncbi:MAG: WG repeat-containing protein, partial [Bacteroidota bacterium]